MLGTGFHANGLEVWALFRRLSILFCRITGSGVRLVCASLTLYLEQFVSRMGWSEWDRLPASTYMKILRHIGECMHEMSFVKRRENRILPRIPL